MSSLPVEAVIQFAGDDMFIGTSPSGHSFAIDTKGDRKSAPTPMELLLVSVAACTAADVISILQKKRQDVTEYRVKVTGSRAEDHPRKYETFHVHHIVHGRGVSNRRSPGRSSFRTQNIARSPQPFARRRR